MIINELNEMPINENKCELWFMSNKSLLMWLKVSVTIIVCYLFM